MIIEREVLEVAEEYTIGDDDTLKIETNGRCTKVFINGEKIDYITKIDLKQEAGEVVKIKIKRCFMQDDFKRIEPIYKEGN